MRDGREDRAAAYLANARPIEADDAGVCCGFSTGHGVWNLVETFHLTGFACGSRVVYGMAAKAEGSLLRPDAHGAPLDERAQNSEFCRATQGIFQR